LFVVVVALAAGGTSTALAESSGSAPAALAFIRAVNLQAGDLPGFFRFTGEGPPRDGSPPEAEEIQDTQESGALRCARHGKRHAPAIEAEGSLLVDRSEEAVGSIVVVMPSEALAKAEIAALASRAARRCLAHGLREAPGIAGSGPRSPIYAIKITVVPVSKTLGQEALDVHMLATLRRSRFRRHRVAKHRFVPPAKVVYSIGAIFRVGAADILFFAISKRRQFPDAATERRLLGLLYNRANSHKL
jgi:hypothetical protein